jgi:hypothetical protein
MRKPTLVLHRHVIDGKALVCVECKKPLDWHKSFGQWCANVFQKGTWQDYLAKELKDSVDV